MFPSQLSRILSMCPNNDGVLYSEVLSSESKFYEPEELKQPDELCTHHKGLRRSDLPWWSWTAQFGLFLCSIIFLILAYQRPVGDAECVKQLFTWSPAFEAVEYHEEDFQGVFHQPSIYRGRPTTELDTHWRKLWNYGAFNVPMDKLHLFNRTSDLPWQRTPEEYGGGAAAMLWGFHQLHCLDTIRQYTWLDVYRNEFNFTPEALEGPDYLTRMHVDHCIEMIRIDMMCNIDTTPFFILEDATAPTGRRAEFSSHHKCRNFDKVQEWVSDNIAIA